MSRPSKARRARNPVARALRNLRPKQKPSSKAYNRKKQRKPGSDRASLPGVRAA